MANETTLTGSIGVIMETLNYQQLFGKVGLETVTFKSGAFKDMLSGSREMTQDEKDYVQKMVMDTYGKFVGIVAHERIASDLRQFQLAGGGLADSAGMHHVAIKGVAPGGHRCPAGAPATGRTRPGAPAHCTRSAG